MILKRTSGYDGRDVYYHINEKLSALGIDAKVKGERKGYWYSVKFKSEEDMNLFKMLSNMVLHNIDSRVNRQVWQYVN